MPSDVVLYCNNMADVRSRLTVIQWVVSGQIGTGSEAINSELIFLQFRKALELIAFASLTANKAAYSAAYANFSEHWNAKRLLDGIEKLNPDFYPMPLDDPIETAPGQKHFPRPVDGFMTKDEFVSLYDASSKVLHTPNPYDTRTAPAALYDVPQWVARIQRLLTWHRVQLLSGGIWIIKIPAVGDVEGFPADPI